MGIIIAVLYSVFAFVITILCGALVLGGLSATLETGRKNRNNINMEKD